MSGIKAAAHRLRIDAHAVWLAARDPRTPWPTRLFGLLIAAYALSPIDLIPDFVPVLGLLDDVVILPLGIWLFLRLVAAERASKRPISRAGAAAIVVLWLLAIALVAAYVWSWRLW
jgi:uncharacterized membrane protein YkvA (DUF1232 family)